VPKTGCICGGSSLHRVNKPCRLGVAAGAALGTAAQVFLVVVIIGYVMPWFCADLLDMARGLADFNLPARVGQLFGVVWSNPVVVVPEMNEFLRRIEKRLTLP